MPDPIHETTSPQQGFGSEFKKLIPSLILTVIVAFCASWWNSQMMQNDLRYRMDRTEERQREASSAAAESAKVAQQNTIRLAELVIIQTNIAEELRDMKTEQQKWLRR